MIGGSERIVTTSATTADSPQRRVACAVRLLALAAVSCALLGCDTESCSLYGCGDGQDPASVCDEPVLLASGEDVRGGLAAGSSVVYWGSGGAPGQIRQLRTDQPDDVASDLAAVNQVGDVVLDTGRLIWLGVVNNGFDRIYTLNGALYGGENDFHDYRGLSVRGTALSWSCSCDPNTVFRGDLNDAERIVIASDLGDAPDTAIDASGVSWIDVAGERVMQNAETVLASGQFGLVDIVSDGERIYWATSTEIRSLANDDPGGEWTDLATGQNLPADIAVGEHLLVWINADGTVNAVSKSGGDVVQLAEAPGVHHVAVDEDGVYYATSSEIWSVPCSTDE